MRSTRVRSTSMARHSNVRAAAGETPSQTGVGVEGDGDAAAATPTRMKKLARSLGITRQSTLQWTSLALIVTTALMIWRVLVLTTRSDSPVVVVLSGSMEPAFARGDLLLLRNERRASEVGEVVVFEIDNRAVPIVHRILRKHENGGDWEDDSRLMLTKGDNNYADDVALYAPGQRWLRESHIVGRAGLLIPHIGRLTILMNDYPWFKFGLIGILGYFVVTGKD